MGAQTLRELELKEKEREETRKRKEEKKKREEKKATVTKKWKGKDWFNILAPKMFNQAFLSETPATDSASLIGRNIEINVGAFLKNPKKHHMKIKFKIIEVSGKNALTRFNGFVCAREYVFKIVRKRSQKVEIINDFETKDGWKLQITGLIILNRNTETTVQRKIRLKAEAMIKEFARNHTINDFVKKIIDEVLQKSIKKKCSKIYPVRFSEITKIEVKKAG
ncbi:MAG: hypothetical protein DRP13_00165 [Candidatus Aenigmatarchaeota archaeon]|nr:MAG: hypothetical protein DRP18_03665 [Candidatus Aenigmarchaeota archaeon]RLJ09340.1 MAG: hypothetical protein DRP13_00165 [Candidatus Aenigmarchaeota archaeon]